MYRIAKEFRFCASHRLESSYTEACQVMHGHNYRVVIVMTCDTLNRDGMVIDYGKLKNIVKPIIDEMDHKTLIPDFYQVRADMEFTDTDKFCTVFGNPTAENIARTIWSRIDDVFHIRHEISDRELSMNGFSRNVQVECVRVHETETSWAEYCGG